MTKTRTGILCMGWLVLALLTTVAFGQLPPGRLLEVNAVEEPPAGQVIAILGARLIDGLGGSPVEDAVVVVRGSKVEAAGPRGTVAIPAGAKRFEASGLTALPGFIDLHLHAPGRPETSALFLRSGVTAARDPGMWIERYDAVFKSARTIPRLFLTGPHFDRAPPAYPNNSLIVRDADHARAMVTQFVEQGASAIKVYFRLPPELIRATCEAARLHGIPVTGHLELVDADVAIEAGLDGLEHVTSVGTAIAEPAMAEAFRAAVNADNSARTDWRYKLWASVDLDSPRVRRMVEMMASRGVVMSPTLTVFFARGPASRNATDEHRRGFANMLGFVRKCHEMGVSIVVGSHTMLGFEPGGKAYQREMELLVDAGMAPMDVIVAATMGGARFLRAEKRIGSIEPGKLADLVLIDGDPTEDIRAMRNISRVMLNGTWIDETPASQETGPIAAAVDDRRNVGMRAVDSNTSSAKDRAPYPASPAIAGIEWAPADEIIRLARGSDTWPLTWADDGHLYTAYGDGWGFEPRVEKKLSLGLARVEGDPPQITGVNLRSAIEEAGDGRRGRKASGMLMVDGTLYMLLRNADRQGRQSQIVWSKDRGKTWTEADWHFELFGYPTFVNFGQNYAGARDEFVYVVSHDNPSAYDRSDRFILMRVPRDRISERSAYEFFVRRDERDRPVWTRRIEERGAVFEHPGRCYRSGISYNAGLGRYVWSQIIPSESAAFTGGQGDVRFEGGFGVYDAPEPWGPWSTVTFTEKWDVGPGETSSFPPKWMSSDGKSMWLVFSGDDHFAVRRATLELKERVLE